MIKDENGVVLLTQKRIRGKIINAPKVNQQLNRKVDSCLKMLINPIYFWLVVSQCYKKVMMKTKDQDFSPERVRPS